MLRTLTSGEVKRGGSGKELNNNDIRNKNGIIVFLGHGTRQLAKSSEPSHRIDKKVENYAVFRYDFELRKLLTVQSDQTKVTLATLSSAHATLGRVICFLHLEK
ncbi:hypothetical protein M8J77_019851 [Diaphorina citri]|nr:hypothetical protein M8J77_019851 [Diaphorina citri]